MQRNKKSSLPGQLSFAQGVTNFISAFCKAPKILLRKSFNKLTKRSGWEAIRKMNIQFTVNILREVCAIWLRLFAAFCGEAKVGPRGSEN
jgi:hypothetical protein